MNNYHDLTPDTTKRIKSKQSNDDSNEEGVSFNLGDQSK